MEPTSPLVPDQPSRERARAAVHAVLNGPGLAGELDAVRLAAVVLQALIPPGEKSVTLRSQSLGEWVGVSLSHVASLVTPGLRRAAWHTAPDGDPGLVFTSPTAAAPDGALRPVVSALFAPGTGLMGTRTGRGAATDRLAFLLLVLDTSATGEVRLIDGPVDSQRGRISATIAALLGCGLPGASKIADRLEAMNLVERRREETASGLYQGTRLFIPAARQ
ncbi:hypothetical protein [Streptomyces sp. enrichment culture]|uniref:hypothetical protein n=1 Tax=Streptomyces sp. enrichment culture TaxID=1795815 RepID=UPI003F547700